MKDNSTLVSKSEKLRAEAGLGEISNRSIDGGYFVGQQFHLTGAVTPTAIEINGRASVMDLVENAEGASISLRSLMGVISLKGYELVGVFDNECDDENGVKINIPVEADFDTSVKEGELFHANERSYRAFMEAVAAGKYNFDGAVLTYCGSIVRPYVARSHSSENSVDTYQKGYKRAISVRVWKIDTSNVVPAAPAESTENAENA